MSNSFGLIVNAIVEELKRDWEGTLRTVASFGYRELEFRGYYGTSRDGFKSFLKETGLRPVAGGQVLSELEKPGVLDYFIEESLALERPYVICYRPWREEKPDRGTDDYRQAAEALNALGAACRRNGLRFAFHNHDTEFGLLPNGQTGYELLAEQTDPAIVSLMLDVYWASVGGADPVHLLQMYGSRISLLHLRDRKPGPEGGIAVPGTGVLPFPAILEAAAAAGVQHYLVELERWHRPLEGLAGAARYLQDQPVFKKGSGYTG